MSLYRNHEQVTKDNRPGWEPFHRTDGGVLLFLSSAKECTIYAYIPRCYKHEPLIHEWMHASFCTVKWLACEI